jgi:hypothetical protein
MTTTRTAGFYGNDSDVVYVTPSGRVWLVASEDDLPAVRELAEMPEGLTGLAGLMTPEECIDYCRQVEEAGGEHLLSE